MRPITDTEKDRWQTPQWIIHLAEQKLIHHPFELDVAALPYNTKCARFITPDQDCLNTEWNAQYCWLNPPYSNPLPFVERAIEQSLKHGLKAVMLLNADNSTKWFSEIVKSAAKIVFLTNGRVAFVSETTNEAVKGNNKPQMLVLFDSKMRQAHGLQTEYWNLKEVKKDVEKNLSK